MQLYFPLKLKGEFNVGMLEKWKGCLISFIFTSFSSNVYDFSPGSDQKPF